jgi:hypothetical protein
MRTRMTLARRVGADPTGVQPDVGARLGPGLPLPAAGRVAVPAATAAAADQRRYTYVSAASTIAGAAETVLGDVLGRRPGAFSLSSPALPGVVRRYRTFSAAAAEDVDARVWGGIHWRTSDVTGRDLGRRIGRYAVHRVLQPNDVPMRRGGR